VRYPRPGCARRPQLVCRPALQLLPTKQSVAGGETTVAQEGTSMNSTVVGTDTLGRTLWVDMGWPACDERLLTVAEAKAPSVGAATTRLPDLQ
jgi:hypothetical protein